MEFGLSLGSNLGDREAHLRAARERLLATADATLLAASSLYETEPVGVQEKYIEMKFVNAVLIIDSEESAEDWLPWLNEIESELGRVRGDDKNAPRPIDIDILYAGDRCIGSRGTDEEQVDGNLIVPHPRWTQRRFVIEPLAEVRGELILPNQSETVAELLARQEDAPLVKLDVDWRSASEWINEEQNSGIRGVSVVCPSCHEAFEVPCPALAEVPCDIDYDCEICCRPMRVGLCEADGEIVGQAYGIED